MGTRKSGPSVLSWRSPLASMQRVNCTVTIQSWLRVCLLYVQSRSVIGLGKCGKGDREKRLGNAGDKQDANVMRQPFYFLILLHQVQLVSRNANFSFVVTIFPFSFWFPFKIPLKSQICYGCNTCLGHYICRGFCLCIVLDKGNGFAVPRNVSLAAAALLHWCTLDVRDCLSG